MDINIIIAIAVIAFIGYALYIGVRTNNYVKENNLKINRPAKFYRLESVYSGKVDTRKVFGNCLNKYKEKLDYLGISVSYHKGEVKLYHGGSKATVVLGPLADKDELYRNRSRVTNYVTGSRSGVHGVLQMNVMLTVIERVLLEIDPDTLVQRQATTWDKQAFTKSKTERINHEILEQNAQDRTPKVPLANDFGISM